MTTEGLDSWVAFTLIDYADFAGTSKNASCHTPSFSLGVLKQKRLSALKFWIEDAARMNEIPTAAAFTPLVLAEYIELYDAFVDCVCSRCHSEYVGDYIHIVNVVKVYDSVFNI